MLTLQDFGYRPGEGAIPPWELAQRRLGPLTLLPAEPGWLTDGELLAFRVRFARSNARGAVAHIRFWRDNGVGWMEPAASAGLREMLAEYRSAQAAAR